MTYGVSDNTVASGYTFRPLKVRLYVGLLKACTVNKNSSMEAANDAARQEGPYRGMILYFVTLYLTGFLLYQQLTGLLASLRGTRLRFLSSFWSP